MNANKKEILSQKISWKVIEEYTRYKPLACIHMHTHEHTYIAHIQSKSEHELSRDQETQVFHGQRDCGRNLNTYHQV